MALIKIDSVAVSDRDNNALKENYLYKDLFLDIDNRVSYNNQLNRTEELKDVLGLFDIEAVKNSIANALLTSPGQKILNPRFGVDLRQYVFEPVSEFTTHSIRMRITRNLPRWEPRISLENVFVEADEEQQEYKITLQINIPSLDVYGLSLRSVLNSNGYNFL